MRVTNVSPSAAPPSSVPPSSVPPSASRGASEPSSTPGPTSDFYPENANITDCVSALPPPECGSRERGGWRQTAVLVVIVAGLAVVAGRIALSLRRRPGTDD